MAFRLQAPFPSSNSPARSPRRPLDFESHVSATNVTPRPYSPPRILPAVAGRSPRGVSPGPGTGTSWRAPTESALQPNLGLNIPPSTIQDLATSSLAFSQEAGKVSPSSSVVGLRDRLLREARIERQRCLEVAEAAERRRLELRSSSNASAQTDPVIIEDSTSGSASALGSTTLSSGVDGSVMRSPWGLEDDQAQAEALQAIKMLGSCGSQAQQAEGLIRKLEAELQLERQRRREIETNLNSERVRKEAAQEQVLCLEHELDGKEAALQVAERTLDQRETEVNQIHRRLQALHDDRWR